jgi:hypothetical protein
MTKNNDNNNDSSTRLIELESLVISYIQVASVFIATAFFIVGLVRDRRRRIYAIALFVFASIILALVLISYFVGRSEVIEAGAEIPARLDVLMGVVILFLIVLLIIIIDYSRGPIYPPDLVSNQYIEE